MSYLDGILEYVPNDLDIDIPPTDEELEGAIDELGQLAKNDPRKKRFIKKVRGKFFTKAGRQLATKSLTAKAEFERRIHLLPPEIQKALKQSRLQIVEGDISVSKSTHQQQYVEVMESKDDKTIGISSINSGKLESNQYFLIIAIQLLYGDAGGTSHEHLKTTNFNGDLPPVIKNGVLQVEQGSEVVIPEIQCEFFNTKGRTDTPQGYYRLENPKLLKPLIEIKPELKMAGLGADNSAVKLRLIGAGLAKK